MRRALGLMALLPLMACAQLSPLEELRYCGPPVRLADGSIRRRADVIAAFRKVHPCPPTMQFKGACAGWQINHVIPLACGGCDAVSNMQWLPNDMKISSDAHAVDRFERKINAATPPVADTAACVNTVVP